MFSFYSRSLVYTPVTADYQGQHETGTSNMEAHDHIMEANWRCEGQADGNIVYRSIH